MIYISVGDVVGHNGIEILRKHLPKLIEENKIDFVIVNIENIADGRGVDAMSFKDVSDIDGIDCYLLGNHTWDRSEVIKLISDKRMVRPYNYGVMPGRGIRHFNKDNKDVFVVQLMGNVNIYKKVDNAFTSFDNALEEIDEYIEKNNKYKEENQEGYIDRDNIYILLDFHVEATSEAKALGYYVDGKVSSMLCSHTHTQTADERILPKGTAYITDIGMTGPYESVLGMEISVAIDRFANEKKSKYKLSDSETNILEAVIVEIDDESKLAKNIRRIRIID